MPVRSIACSIVSAQTRPCVEALAPSAVLTFVEALLEKRGFKQAS
jgi:hypothetical protein